MQNFKKILIVFAAVFCLCGCEAEKMSSHDCDVFAMDTFMTLRVYGENYENPLKDAESCIKRLEKEFSVTDPESDISVINSSHGKPVKVGEDTVNLISSALKYGELSEGKLDITVYPVLCEWGFTKGDYKIPERAALDNLLENVDFSKVSVENDTVSVGENQLIDLGSVAKGYTGDEIIKILKNEGVNSAIVNLGGNVQTLGSKPDGSYWTVSVINPFDTENSICKVKIKDKAVVTSGNYERFFVGGDGKKYWHIIDTENGYPADNGLVSVTVIGESGVMCDALSTALFAGGTDKALYFWKNKQSECDSPFDMILVTNDRKIIYTEGIADNFTNLSDMPAEVIHIDKGN